MLDCFRTNNASEFGFKNIGPAFTGAECLELENSAGGSVAALRRCVAGLFYRALAMAVASIEFSVFRWLILLKT